MLATCTSSRESCYTLVSTTSAALHLLPENETKAPKIILSEEAKADMDVSSTHPSTGDGAVGRTEKDETKLDISGMCYFEAHVRREDLYRSCVP